MHENEKVAFSREYQVCNDGGAIGSKNLTEI